MSRILVGKIKFVVFLAAIISCLVAFINKYPLIYPDTGSYIYSGFNGLVFDDRTIFYGLFVRHISLASSLWYVVFVQGFLLCYLLYKTLSIFNFGEKRDYVFIALITFLTLTTSFSYTVSVLIPDVFSSVTILCLLNLLMNRELNKINKIVISILFVFSICAQLSSVAILLLLFVILAIYFIYKKLKSEQTFIQAKKFLFSLSLFVSSLILIPLVHFSFSKEFKISGGTHVFVMNHLLETGILEDYLKDQCNNKNYKICQYKDSLGWNFIWAPNSALQKTGGWKANKKEYNAIIVDIITTPKYFILLSQKMAEYSFKQFFSFNAEVFPPQLQSTPPYGQINWRFKDSVREYISSLQSASKWDTSFLNFIQTILVVLSFMLLSVIILTPSLFRKLSSELRWAIVLVLVYSLLNAIVCSNLSTVDARFQSRIVWLLPFCAIIVILKYIEYHSFLKKFSAK